MAQIDELEGNPLAKTGETLMRVEQDQKISNGSAATAAKGFAPDWPVQRAIFITDDFEASPLDVILADFEGRS